MRSGSATNTYSFTSNSYLIDGEFHHVVLSYNVSDGVVNLYLNEELDTTYNIPFKDYTDTGIIRIGANRWDGNLPNAAFRSIIDEISIWNRSLDEEDVNFLYNNNLGFQFVKINKTPEPVSQTSLNQNLISYYNFDTDANDQINSNHGNPLNTNSILGKLNNGYQFDGSSYINFFGEDTYFDSYPKSWSVSLWFDKDIDTSGALVSSYDSGGYDGTYMLHVSSSTDNKISISMRSGSSRISYGYVSDTSLPTNQFNHIVVTYNVTTGISKLYLNGNLEKPYIFPNKDYSDNGILRIGSNRWNNNLPNEAFEGIIDEFGISDRELNEDNVLELYNNGDGLSYPFS